MARAPVPASSRLTAGPAPARGGSRTTTSGLPSSPSSSVSPSASTSPCHTSACGKPARLASAAAQAARSDSTQTTRPASPAAGASAPPNRPAPAYRSSTVSPGRTSAKPATAATRASAAAGCTCQNPVPSTSQSRPPARRSARETGSSGSSPPGRTTRLDVGCPRRYSLVVVTAQVESIETYTAPAPGQRRCSTAAAAGSTVIGQSSRTTTSWERCRRSPDAPERSTAKRARDRQRSGPPGSSSTVTATSWSPARRANSSRTTAALSVRCSAGSTCCQSHPPQRPGPLYGQGRSTRAGEGSRTSIASARQNPGWRSSVTRTTTRSPGRLCRTKTTRPSWRATQWPPCATAPTVTSNSVPVHPRPCPWSRRARARRGGTGRPSAIRRHVGRVVGEAPPQVARGRPAPATAAVVPAHRALQLPRDGRDHDAGLELQPCAQAQRALVVQDVLPPVPHDVLRHEDDDDLAGALPADVLDVVDDRPGDLPVRGLEDGQRD